MNRARQSEIAPLWCRRIDPNRAYQNEIAPHWIKNFSKIFLMKFVVTAYFPIASIHSLRFSQHVVASRLRKEDVYE